MNWLLFTLLWTPTRRQALEMAFPQMYSTAKIMSGYESTNALAPSPIFPPYGRPQARRIFVSKESGFINFNWDGNNLTPDEPPGLSKKALFILFLCGVASVPFWWWVVKLIMEALK